MTRRDVRNAIRVDRAWSAAICDEQVFVCGSQPSMTEVRFR
jgi:hypothetical protein